MAPLVYLLRRQYNLRSRLHIRGVSRVKPCTHVRKGKEIRSAEPGDAMMHPTVNKAKKASFKIQMAQDKGLGRGSVKVIPYMPKKRKRESAGQFNVGYRG